MTGIWPRSDHKHLARFVYENAETVRNFNLRETSFELLAPPRDYRNAARTIYEALLAQDVRYDYEEYLPSEVNQKIRTPDEILGHIHRGTCLDLATLFCALCLHNRLLPLLIVFEDHALVAVSLYHKRDEVHNIDRQERELFDEGLLLATDDHEKQASKVERLHELLKNGTYLPIECTGFAKGSKLDKSKPEGRGRAHGDTMPFERAVEAGAEQLKVRHFKFALDLTELHDKLEVKPPPTFPVEHDEAKKTYALPEPSAAPKYPDILVGRDDDLSSLRTRLEGMVSSKSTDFARRLVVLGWPGVGKTALAAALAHDPNVKRAFPDGVLWTSLGLEPNLGSELANWGRVLNNYLQIETSDDLTAASVWLRNHLWNKRKLLIVDDVWNHLHASPFEVWGAKLRDACNNTCRRGRDSSCPYP